MPSGSLIPRPEKGLVHTDCAFVSLYPESGYIIYSHKIPSKLSVFCYVIVFKLAGVTTNANAEGSFYWMESNYRIRAY